MARALDKFLHVKIAVAEGGRRFGLRGFEQCRKFVLAANNAHAASTAAGRRFNNHREANLLGPLHGFAFAGKNPIRTWQNGYARFLHRCASLFFFPHKTHGLGRWPNKLDIAGLSNLGEIGALGEQTISRMDGVHIRDFRRANYRGNIEVALRQLRRANADGFVGKLNVQRVAVSLAINRHGANA